MSLVMYVSARVCRLISCLAFGFIGRGHHVRLCHSSCPTLSSSIVVYYMRARHREKAAFSVSVCSISAILERILVVVEFHSGPRPSTKRRLTNAQDFY